MIGRTLTDIHGKADLGRIKELMLDPRTGRAPYAVVEFGGIAGFGQKDFYYPIGYLSPGEGRDTMMLNVDAPRDPDATAQAQTASGTGRTLLRASTMMGRRLRDSAGNDAGRLTDLLVDLRSGEAHAVLEVAGADRTMDVPLDQLTVIADPAVVRLNRPLGQASTGR
jgi:sporulation protein YlmC with PRC-barrel domain